MRRPDDTTWRVLGNVSLPWSGRDLVASLGTKQVGVLAYLAIKGKVVRREELARMLWPASEISAARHNLRQALIAIKNVLGENADTLIDASADTIFLRKVDLTIDLRLFEDAESKTTASTELVLDICRGPLLDGFSSGSEAFDSEIRSLRAEYNSRMASLILRTIKTARTSNRSAQALNARLQQISEELSAAPIAIESAEMETPGIRGGKLRIGLALAIGLSIGALTIFGTYAIFPEFRGYLRKTIISPLSEAPKIAVWPFESLNGTQVERNLAGGVTIGVTYGLYSVAARELSVVTAPTNSEKFDSIGEKAFAEELGVRYLISGTVEHADGNVRVFVRCLDVELGYDIWQDRFTRPLTEAFELQDEIALRILSRLEIDLSAAERNRLQYLDDTDNLQAWLYAANGVSNLIKLTPDNLAAALSSYKAALQIDPDYISARRGLAWHALLQVRFGLSPDPEASIVEARQHINVILRHRPDDGMSKALEGLLLLLEGSWDAATKSGETASELLPGSADVWAVLAHTYSFVDKPDQALDAIERAMELSPGHPLFYDWIEARALRTKGEIAGAIEILERETAPEDDSLVRLVELAAAYSAANRLEDAQTIAAQIREIDPTFSASNWVLHPAAQDPELQSTEFELLSKAGL